MEKLYGMGIRILFFCGGETFLWNDGDKTIRDLVREAREMGFLIVNTVTNGTFPLDLPEADLILLSLDGDKEKHNEIRGDTYDRIMENIRNASSDNICFYMAINRINRHTVRDVCIKARDTDNVRAVSFNFHTPYPDTAELALSREEKAGCCDAIALMKKQGAPVFNLLSAFPYIINNSFPTPCHQCIVMEDGEISTCGRCYIKFSKVDCNYNSLIVSVIAMLHIRFDGERAAITAETKIKTITTASNAIGKCHATPK